MQNPYGKPPLDLGEFNFDLSEVMYYLYLPVRMPRESFVCLPANIERIRPLIRRAEGFALGRYDYTYVSARKGWATPDNPLNRPGWHCDGFGTDDLNFVWWAGPGTRFALQQFHDISDDHVESLAQFEQQVHPMMVDTPPEKHLYALDPYVVHATPLLKQGCMRQYVKISLSNSRYNLENNSHNYLFDYDWPLTARDEVRNDTYKAQKDFS